MTCNRSLQQDTLPSLTIPCLVKCRYVEQGFQNSHSHIFCSSLWQTSSSLLMFLSQGTAIYDDQQASARRCYFLIVSGDPLNVTCLTKQTRTPDCQVLKTLRLEICEYSHLLAFTSLCLKKNHVVEMDRTVKLVHRASPNHVWSLSDFGPDTLSTLYRTLSTVPSCCGSSPWLLRPIVWHCGYYPLFPSDIRCGR
jgi:hypothetical protein